MVTVEVDPVRVESRLAAGELRCSSCPDGVLARWGFARSRRVVGLADPVRPRRSRCRGCAVTHVLLPVSLLLRRAYAAELIWAVLEAKAGMLLLSAYGKLLCRADSGVAAMVGDGERQVTLRNLGFFGFRPQVMPARDASIPAEHLYANRYQGREVHPFWLRLDAIDHERVAQIEGLIELEGDEFLSQLRDAKQHTPLHIGA